MGHASQLYILPELRIQQRKMICVLLVVILYKQPFSFIGLGLHLPVTERLGMTPRTKLSVFFYIVQTAFVTLYRRSGPGGHP